MLVVAVAMTLLPEHLGRCQDLTSAETLTGTGFVYTCKFFLYRFVGNFVLMNFSPGIDFNIERLFHQSINTKRHALQGA